MTDVITAPCISCGTPTENVEHVCTDCTAGARARLAVQQLSDEDLTAARPGGRPSKSETSERSEVSNVAIARQVGVDEGTVRRARQAEIASRGLEPPLAPQAQGSQTDLNELVGVDQQVSTLPQYVADDLGEGTEGDPDIDSRKPHITAATGRFEWYTPDWILGIARHTMGGIDLDPASCAAAQEHVQAARFYTMEEDGLEQPWYGRVWLNPPFAAGLIDRFAEKMASDVREGNVSEACWISNNATETVWFSEIASVAAAMFLPRGRVRFWAPEERPDSAPLQGQALVYMGPDVDMFAEAVAKHDGSLWVPYRSED